LLRRFLPALFLFAPALTQGVHLRQEPANELLDVGADFS
jgi:hypothetical protein